jgi:hypothetical protein
MMPFAHARRAAIGAGIVAALALTCAGCASLASPVAPDGMPLDAFLDDLKTQLREVHWHVRGDVLGCDGSGPREVDLRDATITLELARIEQRDVDASVKLVALPLGALAVSPGLSAEASGKRSQTLSVKLAAAGDAPVVDLAHAPSARSPVARAVNAAIDGFMRAGRDPPCVRLTALHLVLVVDVTRDASGAFKVVVPALAFDAGASERNANTLTLDWARIESRPLR